VIVGCVSLGEWSGARVKHEAHIVQETAKPAPEIPFFKVLPALDMTSEQSKTERAVRGVSGRGDDEERELRTNKR